MKLLESHAPPPPPPTCQTATGAEIEIEERPASELKTVAGTKVAPDGIAAWNPAFDVTPAGLITAIVTDKGLVPRKGGGGGGEKCFDVKAFCESNAAGEVSWSAGFWGDGPVGGEPGWMNAGNLSVCQSVSLSVCQSVSVD